MLSATLTLKLSAGDIEKASGALSNLISGQEKGPCRLRLVIVGEGESIIIPCQRKMKLNADFLEAIKNIAGLTHALVY